MSSIAIFHGKIQDLKIIEIVGKTYSVYSGYIAIAQGEYEKLPIITYKEIKSDVHYLFIGYLNIVNDELKYEVQAFEPLTESNGFMVANATVIRINERGSDDKKFISLSLACKQQAKGDDGYPMTTWVNVLTNGTHHLQYIKPKESIVETLGALSIGKYEGKPQLTIKGSKVQYLSKASGNSGETKAAAKKATQQVTSNVDETDTIPF